MEPFPFLHPCSEAPSNNDDFKKTDAKCLQEISKYFITKDGGVKLGEGNNATVFKLHSIHHYELTVAVKIVPYANLGNKEIGIACELNQMKNFTPVVIRTYGYLVCDRNNLHKRWVRSVPVPYNNDSQYMLMFMEAPPYKWKYADDKDNPFPIEKKDDALALFFVMAHALYVLRKYLGFVHGDLHHDNILLSIHPNQDAPVRLFFDDNNYSDVTLPYGMMPKFIDYGTAYTNNYPSLGPQRPFTDTEMLLNLFDNTSRFGRNDISQLVNMKKLLKQKLSKPRLKEFLEPQSVDILYTVLRNIGIFDNLTTIIHYKIEDEQRPLKRTKKCIQCGIGEGTYKLQGKEGLLCGEYCNGMIGDMAHFLPTEPSPLIYY